jgi:hypothetical protein
MGSSGPVLLPSTLTENRQIKMLHFEEGDNTVGSMPETFKIKNCG